MEGRIISQEILSKFKDSNNIKNKFWIHRVNYEHLREINDNRILGAKKEKSLIMYKINPGDRLILYSTISTKNVRNRICFFAYTMVKEKICNGEILYDTLYSEKKLQLKGIKYFSEPIMISDIASDLDFIKDPDSIHNSLVSEYKQVSEEDFKKILNKTSLSKEYPSYLEEISFPLNDFLLNAINSLFLTIKSTTEIKQMEIKTFIMHFKHMLEEFDIFKTYDEVEDFYTKNVWKLGFKHNPSRNPDKFLVLYGKSGKKMRFSYISFK
ncbi:EVE domain-containing protein [Methanobrevibacter filiformis]|nr:hypothetical protein [Methanobrevibacter filiformis]